MKIDLLELFSGTGGFTKGLQEAGFEINKHWYSEVDKHANRYKMMGNAVTVAVVKAVGGKHFKVF